MDSGKKISIKNLESFLIDWNYRFRFDRLYRKKYNIKFLSREHLEANQIDMYLDLFEDRLVEKAQLAYDKRKKDLEEYRQTGKFLSEQEVDEDAEERLFKKFRLK